MNERMARFARSYQYPTIWPRSLMPVAKVEAKRPPGCVEIASDTWIDNEVSQRAHEASGYEVVDRCVHYRKTL